MQNPLDGFAALCSIPKSPLHRFSPHFIAPAVYLIEMKPWVLLTLLTQFIFGPSLAAAGARPGGERNRDLLSHDLPAPQRIRPARAFENVGGRRDHGESPKFRKIG